MISRLLVALAVLAIVLSGLVLLVGPGQHTTCDEGSPSVAYARSLKEADLSVLFHEVEKLVADGVQLHRVPASSKELPEVLSTFRFESISVDRERVRILLERCMDSYVTLTFHGFSDSRSPAVPLNWGEGPTSGSQLIWQSGS